MASSAARMRAHMQLAAEPNFIPFIYVLLVLLIICVWTFRAPTMAALR